MKKILILYMSQREHTARIARTLMATILAAGWACDMMNLVEATHEGVEWDQYSTVVVGAPVL